ncbi:hypothetical protein IDM32_06610 [Acinetobacter seifertii]|nr:hypothetical protein [Acinetobacter seifertii]
MNFRFDINGLRAYAVAFVVLFHFGVFGFTAGFIGVDVFFVISGFLMTKIIMDGLKRDNFSIYNSIQIELYVLSQHLLYCGILLFLVGLN